MIKFLLFVFFIVLNSICYSKSKSDSLEYFNKQKKYIKFLMRDMNKMCYENPQFLYKCLLDTILSDDIVEYIRKQNVYNKKALRRAYKIGIERSRFPIKTALVVPTFLSVENRSIKNFIKTLMFDKKYVYDLILGSVSTYPCDFVLEYIIYKNDILKCSDSSFLFYDCNDIYLSVQKAFITLYFHILKDMNLWNNVFLFRVIDYEDYWFLLKEDKLWAYSLSKQILYTTEEQVTRIIQHKEVE